MGRILKILQIASFQGNLGDNANITGSRKQLRRHLDFDLNFTDLEIREFFWKERSYDEEFAEYVNQFDLLIFGGGNFFELWVDHSSNNTSVDISIPILKLIKIPIIFYALGMDIGMGVSSEGIAKFKKWLDYVISNEQFVLSLRNDGSYEVANKYLGEKYIKHFKKLPDGGFFTEISDFKHIEIPSNKKVIGMNLAGDMLDIRFPEKGKDDISYVDFQKSLGLVFDQLLDTLPDLHLVIFPHIYKDFTIITDFLFNIKDKYARSRITIAPYIQGFEAQAYVFDAYSKCDIIMGNRFHTNVCAIGLNVPTIGFINYRQIDQLYKELALSNRAINVNKKGFDRILISLILETFENSDSLKAAYKLILDKLRIESDQFHSSINIWLKKRFDFRPLDNTHN